MRVASSTQGRRAQNLRRTAPVFTVDAIFCAAPVSTRKANLGALRETRRPVSVFISDFSVTFSGVFSRVKFLDEFVLKSCVITYNLYRFFILFILLYKAKNRSKAVFYFRLFSVILINIEMLNKSI